MSDIILTLFSSDQTLQYEQDIFSVLSLPRDSAFQFRYQKEYVEDSVKALFANTEKKLNNRALIVFKSNTNTPDEEGFCIPIRWVKIKNVESISNGGWVITFITQGYPKFTSQFATNENGLDGIHQSARRIFSMMSKRDLAVLGNAIDLVEIEENKSNPERDSENWYEIIKKISLIPAYKDFHFLKCSKFYTRKMNLKSGLGEKVYCNIKDSCIVATEGRPFYIDIEYFAATYNRTMRREIDVLVNGDIVNGVNGLQTAIQSRYGTKKLGFQVKKVANNTITEIVVISKNVQNEEMQVELVFPIVVQKDKRYRVIKSVIMGLGALFVALPGIIGDKLRLEWNLLFAALGVLILGIGSYLESKE